METIKAAGRCRLAGKAILQKNAHSSGENAQIMRSRHEGVVRIHGTNPGASQGIQCSFIAIFRSAREPAQA